MKEMSLYEEIAFCQIFFRFNTIHTIMGAPKTAVTALMGKVLLATGI
jgi:hypothetical protein